MSPKQKNILSFLLQLNILVFSVLAILIFAVPRLEAYVNAQATAAALRAQATAIALQNVKPTPTLTPQPSRTARPIVPTPVVRVAPTIAAPAAVIAAPGGLVPSNPLSPKDAWQTLNPGASVWYKLGNGGDHIDAFLEANPLDEMTLQVFAPGNLERPIGQGTYQQATGRLVWAGGKWNSNGDWLARIANSGSAAAQYKLTAVTREIGQCDSISYWEKIGDADVYWTRCK